MNKTPLALDGWVEYNCRKWNLKPLKLDLSANEGHSTFVKAVFYLDSKGKIISPDLTPYTPVHFEYTSTESFPRRYRQSIELAELLINEIKKYKIANYIFLPTDIIDIRTWQWEGYRTNIRYTLLLDLPVDLTSAHHSVRKNIKKAVEEFRFERIYDSYEKVIECITDTEQRQGFSYNIGAEDLNLLRNLITDENFRIYAAFDAFGKIIATRIILAVQNGVAIDWIAATRKEHLNSGITQGLIHYILEDLNSFGVKQFDFVGAGFPNVALAKVDWGAKLTPYYMINQFGLKWLWYLLRSRIKSNKKIPVYC